MIGAIADLISSGIDWYKSKNRISRLDFHIKILLHVYLSFSEKITMLYMLCGSIMLILVPAFIFNRVEGEQLN